MTSEDTRRYAMLVRVQKFGEANKELFPENSVGGQALAAVAAAVAQLGGYSETMLTLTKEARSTKRLARVDLTDRLIAISKTARVIGESVAGFGDTFTLNRGRISDQALLTNGRVFVRESERLKEQFIAYKLPPTFAADLNEAVTRFASVIDNREAGKSGRDGAQAGIEAAFESGLAGVRRLDAVLANQLKADPVKQAAWKRIRKLATVKSRKSRTIEEAVTVDAASSSAPASGAVNVAAMPPASGPPGDSGAAAETATPAAGEASLKVAS